MKEQRVDRIMRIGAVIVLCALAAARTFGSQWKASMDETFFIVVGVAIVLALIPITRLKHLKAGSLEFDLSRPEVEGAIGGLNLKRIQNAKLRATLKRASENLHTIRGSRVLWIDDRPEKIVALRRLLRSLGVGVVAAASSEEADHALKTDSDFDLLISDVQRHGESHATTGGIEIHEGTNYVVLLRTKCTDPVVRSIPVVFYAAYDWEKLVEFTRPARETQPEPKISNSVPDFIAKVVAALVDIRSAPINAGGDKEPTWARDET